MEVSIKRVVLFAWGCISLCLLQHLEASEAVFSVGHSHEERKHSANTSPSWLFNSWRSSGERYDQPVIQIFGEGRDSHKDGDGHIDLLLPSQRLISSPSSTPPVPPLPPPFPSAVSPSSPSSTPAPASPFSPSPSPTTPSLSPTFPPPSISPSPAPYPFSPPPIPAPSSSAPSPTLSPSTSPSPSPSPVSPPSIPPSSPTLSPASSPAPIVSPPTLTPSQSPSSIVPSPFIPPSPTPSSIVSPPTLPPSPSPSPVISPSPSTYPILPPSPSPSSSPILPPSSSPSPSIFPPSQSPSPSPSPIFSPSPSPSILPPSQSPSPSPSPSPSQSPSASPSSSPSPTPSIPSPPSPLPPSPTPAPVSILANLIVSGAELVPEFDPYVFNYTASFEAKVRRFHVTAYVPKDEDYKLSSLYIENAQLNAGERSPPLKLGKRGETVTYRVVVKEIGHDLSTYVLSISREAGHKGLGPVAIVFILLVCIVGVLVLSVFAYGAYVYAHTGRIPQPRDLLSREGRSSLYTPLVAGGESDAARTL